jgi:hypothetical protein
MLTIVILSVALIPVVLSWAYRGFPLGHHHLSNHPL